MVDERSSSSALIESEKEQCNERSDFVRSLDLHNSRTLNKRNEEMVEEEEKEDEEQEAEEAEGIARGITKNHLYTQMLDSY